MENQGNKITVRSGLLITLSILLLAGMYLFQQFNFLHFFLSWVNAQGVPSPYFTFVFNKTLRLIVNDGACLLLIYALFKKKKYLQVAGMVLLIELLVLLPVYFILKYVLEGDSEISSPLLSQLHRLIINPTLMIMLIIAFYYQHYKMARRET
jgi:exosortase F-associated protein